MLNMTQVCQANRGLVYHFAQKYVGMCKRDRAADVEDLAQAGYIGLINAMRDYDNSKGTFSHWAGLHIRKEIREALGIRSTRKRADLYAVSLDARIGDSDDTFTLGDTLADETADTPGVIEHDELVDAVREQVDKLPEMPRVVVQRHDLIGESLSDIAQEKGVPYHEVTADRRRAFKQLKKALQPLAKAHGLDQCTRWYRHVGVNEYHSTWLSSTEMLVYWREEGGSNVILY